MSSDDFIALLQSQGKQLTWERHFLPQVHKIVKSVLIQCNETFESRPQFFELLGFDFAMDSELNLWLIEVNMSPACAERQPWLVNMLDDMSNGLVKMIHSKIQAQGNFREAMEDT